MMPETLTTGDGGRLLARFTATLKLDMLVQWRARFYIIGVALALLTGLGLRGVVAPGDPGRALSVIALLVVGGTTFIYIAGLLIFERGENTLNAQFVSPLSLGEYLAAKLASLTLLVLAEGLTLALASGAALSPLGWGLYALGTALLGAMMALFGLILVVRFDSITDFLIPALLIAAPLQLPAIYFAGLSDSPAWLVIPTSAPTLLIAGAWTPLDAGGWLYGLGYALLGIAVATLWARHAFTRRIIEKRG